jgi:hypothetical protein
LAKIMAEDAVQDRSKMYEGMGWDWAQMIKTIQTKVTDEATKYLQKC